MNPSLCVHGGPRSRSWPSSPNPLIDIELVWTWTVFGRSRFDDDDDCFILRPRFEYETVFIGHRAGRPRAKSSPRSEFYWPVSVLILFCSRMGALRFGCGISRGRWSSHPAIRWGLLRKFEFNDHRQDQKREEFHATFREHLSGWNFMGAP